ncbi:MAG: hypothetical protein EA425_04995 [Puniceicoccaceae bacterium]|nr:MAG: hypothetical protein EA425_04995 [Puniceicoccaceae bacterium]
MAIHGGYELVGEIVVRGHGGVHHARHTTTGEAAVLKLRHGRAEDDPALGGFERAAALQQSLGENGRGWLPVLARGRDGATAWYAAPVCDGSLQTFIERLFRWDGPSLAAVVGRIIDALEAIESSAGRGHGNLRPANVLFAGQGSLKERRWLLADPAAEDNGSARADRQALGRLIYQLAGRRETLRETVRTVAREENWSHLGPAAENWKDFCTALLDPDGRLAKASWEEIRAEVSRLGRPPSRKGPLLAGVLAAGLAVAVGIFFWITREEELTQEEIAAVEESWRTYFRAYDDWLRALETEVGRNPEHPLWTRNPGLAAALRDPLLARREQNLPLNPLDVVEASGDPLLFRNTPPGRAFRRASRERLAAAVRMVGRMEAGLESWAGFDRTGELSGRFLELGWEAPAGEVGALARPWPMGRRLWRELVDRDEALARGVSLLDGYDRLTSLAADLATGEDRLLGGLEAFVQSTLEQPPGLEALAARLAEAEELVRDVATVATSNRFLRQTDRALFRREVVDELETDPPTRESIRTWLRSVEDFAFLDPDPRLAAVERWQGILGSIREDLAELDVFDGEAEAEAFRGEIARFLSEVSGVQQVAGVVRHRARLADRLEELERQLTLLRNRVFDTLQEKRPDIGEWLAQVSDLTLPGSPALNREWERRRAALLDGVDETTFPDLREFLDFRRGVDRLRTFLTELDGTVPPAALSPEATEGAAAEALARLLRERRESVVEEVVAPLPPGPPPSDLEPEDFLARDAIRPLVAGWRQTLEDAAGLGPDLVRLENAIETAVSWGGFPSSFAGRWAGHELFRSLADQPAVAGMVEELNALETMQAEAEAGQLLAWADDEDLSLARRMEAWRRLGAVNEWPATPEDLEREESLAARLGPRLGGAVRDELEAESRSRFLDYLGRVRQTEALERALARMEAFGVEVEDLPANQRFNHFLYRATAALTPRVLGRAELDLVRRERDRLLDDLGGLGEARDLTPARELTASLRDLELEGAPVSVDLSTAGPAARGWTLETDPYGEDYTVSWSGYLLEFLPVETDEGITYVARTALSVGLFIDWAWEEGLWEELRPRLPVEMRDFDGNDPRLGPRTWVPEGPGGGFAPVEDWFAPWPEWFAVELYPAGIDPGRADDLSLPIQYLPPEVFRLLAESLGCSLLRPEVWRAALERNRVAGAPTNANLRDATWSRQHAHIAATVERLQPLVALWPDSDAFGPGVMPGIQTGAAAVPATQRDDGVLWFLPVDARPDEPFQHLIGNVAEFLHDPEAGRFYVAGGSALSAPEIDPEVPVPLPPGRGRSGYSDVGVRLSFAAPLATPGWQLVRLVRDQSYVFN